MSRIADQAIFTSMRHSSPSLSGYHLVSRSGGINSEEASALMRWGPSHGALIVDAANSVSINCHFLPTGRLVLSRTCAGGPEYSGRGGQQIYTHSLVLDPSTLEADGIHPMILYRDALALGHLRYRPMPGDILPAVMLSESGPANAMALAPLPDEPDAETIDQLCQRLGNGEDCYLGYDGDRIHLIERILQRLPAPVRVRVSFSTSLTPSSARPFQLVLVGTQSEAPSWIRPAPEQVVRTYLTPST